MTCPACGQAKRAGRKFCVECGGALAFACSASGAPFETGQKFCGECGAGLGAAAPFAMLEEALRAATRGSNRMFEAWVRAGLVKALLGRSELDGAEQEANTAVMGETAQVDRLGPIPKGVTIDG